MDNKGVCRPSASVAVVSPTRPTPAAPADLRAAPDDNAFRGRLLQGLADSIRARGYRETTVADIVRHAKTSRRTFYEEFDSRDDCFIALLRMTNKLMVGLVDQAVDKDDPWDVQIRSAIVAHIEAVASEPELNLSWIRELPALGPPAQVVIRESLDAFARLILLRADTPELRAAGLQPPSYETVLILLGGIRELTAHIVEDGGDVRGVIDPAFQAAKGLFGPADR